MSAATKGTPPLEERPLEAPPSMLSVSPCLTADALRQMRRRHCQHSPSLRFAELRAFLAEAAAKSARYTKPLRGRETIHSFCSHATVFEAWAVVQHVAARNTKCIRLQAT